MILDVFLDSGVFAAAITPGKVFGQLRESRGDIGILRGVMLR
jgi:hypothetical protein